MPSGATASLRVGSDFGSVGTVRGEIVRDGQVLCSGTVDISFRGAPSPIPWDYGPKVCSADI